MTIRGAEWFTIRLSRSIQTALIILISCGFALSLGCSSNPTPTGSVILTTGTYASSATTLTSTATISIPPDR